MAKFLPCRVVENQLLGSSHYILRVQAPESIKFIPGQFTRLGLHIDDELVARAYSFVNAPAEPLLEFYSIVVPDGSFSTRLMQLRAGAEILVSDLPSGFLTLPETPSGDNIWLLATGTGIGPFISLIRAGEIFSKFARVIVVHAVRYPGELNYHQELQQHCQRYNQLRYIFITSREQHNGALFGRIPQHIASGCLQDTAGVAITPEQSRIMLCGNPDMLTDTTNQLELIGLRRHRRRKPGQILMEKYWS